MDLNKEIQNLYKAFINWFMVPEFPRKLGSLPNSRAGFVNKLQSLNNDAIWMETAKA